MFYTQYELLGTCIYELNARNKTGTENEFCNSYIENDIYIKNFGKVENDLRRFYFRKLSPEYIEILGRQFDIDSYYTITLN